MELFSQMFCLLDLWMKSYGVTIQMKATEQYFPVVLFIMLHKVVLTFESCGWNHMEWEFMSYCRTAYHFVQGGSSFRFMQTSFQCHFPMDNMLTLISPCNHSQATWAVWRQLTAV